MNNYKTVKIEKSSIIYEEGNYPKNSFYIIAKGNAISYKMGSKNYDCKYKEGHIIGLVNTSINEPYFFTTEAKEDMEALELTMEDIQNIKNTHLIKKIYKYLSFTFEIWKAKYFSLIVKDKTELYNKEDLLTMLQIYKDNNFDDAAYKLYQDYLEYFHNDENIEKAKGAVKTLKPSPEPLGFTDNIYLYKKGTCLFTEFVSNNLIYIIKSGTVGLFNVLNKKLLVNNIYKNNYIISCYEPENSYATLKKTAIALEDTYIKVLKKDEFIEVIIKDKQLRTYYIKLMAIKIINATLKIRAIEETNITLKLFIIIYAILKIEISFTYKENIILSYKVDDIKNMLNLEDIDIINELNKIKNVKTLANTNIEIISVENFFEEYYEYEKSQL